MKKTALVLSALAFSIGMAMGPVTASAAETASSSTQQLPSLAPMLEKVMPSVVSINVEGSTTVNTPRMPQQFQQFFGEDSPFCQDGSPFQGSPMCQGGEQPGPDGQPQGTQQKFQALGAGVVIDAAKGYVVTNNHVVDNANKIQVQLSDGRRFDAKVIGKDPRSDIALIQLKDFKNLTAIKMADSDQLRVGDYTVAIGNPYGLGETATSGIVSALGRSGLNIENYENFIQTDAAINRGNSGGALVNSLGELIGINTLTYDKITDGETPEGLGFAIPIELATKIMDKLIRDGRVIRGYFGIQGKEIIPLRPSNSGIDRLQGIIVTEITPNGPASNAGFQINDIIINVDNKPAVSVLETMDQVAEIRPGTEIPVIVLRDGKRITLKMTVGEFPEDSN
ncbi:PDZ domain-containing protein [Serratia marcescens]|nr:PDZ domain-containing protein [Serratia marcescens]